ncbi:ISL3 family transposase [Planctomycetota bacterium]
MDKTIFYGDVHPNTLKCPSCRSRRIIQFGQKARVFKMLPVGRRKVELVVNIPRLYCNDCGAIRQPHLAFAEPKKHYTRSLEYFVIDLCRVASIQDVAELTGLGWDTVKEIHKRHLRRKYKSFNLKNVRYLGIDEVYLGKKRKYITIVLDLRTGRVIHMGRGKGKDALKGFWKRLRWSKAKIQAVATDMASGYIAAVLEHLPKADLVLDHFHLVKWFNEKLSLLRRQLYREATQMEKAVLEGSRWLLVKAPEHLKSHRDPKKDERRRLQAALELNQPLAMAYYMKEPLRLLFQCTDRDRAAMELKAWIQEASSSGIRILQEAARKLSVWKPFILNWHKHRISTGKLEVINGKIGTLQRNAYGYRSARLDHNQCMLMTNGLALLLVVTLGRNATRKSHLWIKKFRFSS